MTLTQTALITKRAIVITAVTLFLIIGAKIGYQVWYANQLASLPKIADKPEEKFGTLPQLTYPDAQVSSSNFSYSLDTPTGSFPDIPKLVNVYFIPQSGISLLAPERSIELAVKLGFGTKPQILSDSSYQFSDNAGGDLLIDLPTGNFHFQRVVATNSAQPSGFSESSEDIIKNFKTFLRDKNLLTDPIQQGKINIVFDNLDTTKSQTATISALPADFNKLPIINITPYGLVKTLINTNPDEQKRYLQMDYVVWLIDSTTFSSYPIKDPQKAFAQLQSGEGFVIIPPLKPQVSITDVHLAYYQSENYSPYLQPVYVFEGPHYQAIVQATIPKD